MTNIHPEDSFYISIIYDFIIDFESYCIYAKT